MRMSRRMGLLDNNLPLADVFSHVTNGLIIGCNSTSKKTVTLSFPAEDADWFSFYACGSSLEIKRIITTENSRRVSFISRTAASEADKKTSTLDGSSLKTSSEYANTIFAVKFDYSVYSANLIERMLLKCVVERIKYYGPSSTKATASNVRMTAADIPSKGIVLAMFNLGSSSTATWSVASAATPLTAIDGVYGSSWIARTAYYNNGTYLLPTTNGSSSCATSLNGYSVFRLY